MSAAGPEPIADTVRDEADRVAATVAGFLPPALVPYFGPGFTRSHLLFDEYVYRLTLRVCVAAGLAAALADWTTVAEAMARARLHAQASAVPVDWMLRHLAARGALERSDDGTAPRFRAPEGLPPVDADTVLAAQRAHDPGCLPAYALAATAARDYPAFLHGERSGEEILLSPTRLSLWTSYFSNDNALYAVNNRVGAAALEAWMPRGPHTIVELGGGLGSGALAILEWLVAAGRLAEVQAYRFTELVPAFLRRAQRLAEGVPAVAGLSFAPLDMNRPFAEQGVEPQTASIVYAVNTLHVAHDLAFTLGEVRRTLRPGGQLIVSECVRPTPGQTLYPEFIFNLMATFRTPRLHPLYRPNGGFLRPEEWTAALEAAGLVDVRVFPEIAWLRTVPIFCVAAIGGTRRG